MVRQPLAGIRVLDFTWALAGPYGTLQLALLGAEVIKVESVRARDGTRRGAYPLADDPESSPTFNSVNLNKLGLQLNLKAPAGVDAALELARVSDIVVENFRTGVLDRMGLDYQTLRSRNPSIIVASMAAFGSEGPHRNYPGYASVFNAISGLGNLSGYIDGPPVELRDSIDLRVGTALAYACLVALYHRRHTGRGQYIDLSAMEAVADLAGHRFLSYQLAGVEPSRQGNRDDAMAPHGIYRCRGDDAWVSVAVGTEAAFRSLCHVIGQPDVAADPRFADAYRRLRHTDDLDQAIEAWTESRTQDEATRLLQAAGVAAFPVLSNREVYLDPHVNERGAWLQVEHAVLGKRSVQRLAWKAHDSDAAPSPGPLMGQHNGYILGDVLGKSRHEIEDLLRADLES